MNVARTLGAVGLIGGVAFGAMGGEYSTVDWLKLEQQIGQEERLTGRLGIEIDSLQRHIRWLESDSATVERVARELFGMIRDGETLYRLESGER